MKTLKGLLAIKITSDVVYRSPFGFILFFQLEFFLITELYKFCIFSEYETFTRYIIYECLILACGLCIHFQWCIS